MVRAALATLTGLMCVVARGGDDDEAWAKLQSTLLGAGMTGIRTRWSWYKYRSLVRSL